MRTLAMAVFALALIAVAFAAGPDPKTGGVRADAVNGTYGTCVSTSAAVKNTCYADVKAARAACLDATNETSAEKACKADYKQDKKACKNDFKAAKKECARTYKPGVFEKMQNAFK